MSDIYEKLLSMVIPKAVLPEVLTNVMVEATRAAVTVEQAEFTLKQAQEFDDKFGEGEYASSSARMSAAVMELLTGALGGLDGDPVSGMPIWDVPGDCPGGCDLLAQHLERTANNDLDTEGREESYSACLNRWNFRPFDQEQD
jgi:hypothetical protein